MDIMRQSARLVVNPITVDSYAFLLDIEMCRRPNYDIAYRKH